MSEIIKLICMGIAFLMAFLPLAHAATELPAASFTVVKGDVDLKKAAATAPIPAVVGLEAFLGDVVKTNTRSRTQLKFMDGSTVNLGSNYYIEIKDFSYNAETKVRKSLIRSMRGTLRAVVSQVDGADSSFEIETPSAVASVRGTDFFVTVGANGMTDIVVVKGAVAVRNINPSIIGEVMVRPSQMTRVQTGKPPIPPRQVKPENIQVMVQKVASVKKHSQKKTAAEEVAPLVAPLGTPEITGGNVVDPIIAMSVPVVASSAVIAAQETAAVTTQAAAPEPAGSTQVTTAVTTQAAAPEPAGGTQATTAVTAPPVVTKFIPMRVPIKTLNVVGNLGGNQASLAPLPAATPPITNTPVFTVPAPAPVAGTTPVKFVLSFP
ncbi:MAG: FecR domain-containing protein [Mariprofundus sp.]|nr:FecR domain-containing protein [Mariprofundus sp.]